VIFSFIDEDHPFHSCLTQLREELHAAGPTAPSGRTVVSSEIRGRLTEGGFALDRFYWSSQSWSDSGQFSATSLYSSSTEDAPRWFRFPDDPRLVTVAPYLRDRGLDRLDSGVEVLRYMPLRRFTFRTPDRHEGAASAVGKFKRPSKLEESYGRTTAISAAVGQAATGFAVPRPAGLDVDNSVYFQDSVDGVDLAAESAHDAGALETAAEVLAAVHSVKVPSLPPLDEAVFITALDRDLQWIAFHDSGLADLTDRARKALRDRPSIEATVLAHGDFVPSHVLRGADGLTVIDLDLAHVGDRYRDLAIMLASLALDSPTVEPDVEAILAAYEGRAGLTLDRRRLAWHHLAAEIYYLAVAFTKDRPIDPLAVASALAELETL
jgi:aminoglycoside phosphotransferase